MADLVLSTEQLRNLLRQAEVREAEAAVSTPHTVLLADLADERVHPRAIGAAFARIFDALDALGVDLLADGGPQMRPAIVLNDDDPAIDPAWVDDSLIDPVASVGTTKQKGGK